MLGLIIRPTGGACGCGLTPCACVDYDPALDGQDLERACDKRVLARLLAMEAVAADDVAERAMERLASHLAKWALVDRAAAAAAAPAVYVTVSAAWSSSSQTRVWTVSRRAHSSVNDVDSWVRVSVSRAWRRR